MFKIDLIKSNHRIRRKNVVDTNGACNYFANALASDYSAAVSAAKLLTLTNPHEHAINIRYLWFLTH
jgi:hypothetical protein